MARSPRSCPSSPTPSWRPSLTPRPREARGPISLEEAIDLVRTFPFEAEVRKREADADLTVPTLTFTTEADADGRQLAIWSADPGEFLLWVPAIFALVGGVTDLEDVVDCVELFFEGDIETLGIRMIRMGEKYAGAGGEASVEDDDETLD